MGRLVPFVVLAIASASLAVACHRPGTDRDLNCERYADILVTRSFECGAKEVNGQALSTANAGDVAKKVAAACEKDESITASADCVKAIKKATCEGSQLAPADLAPCRK